MPIELMSVAAFFGGAILSSIASSKLDAKGAQLQQEILKRGEEAQGRIVKVWRPPLMGSFARIHFEFQPAGSSDTVHCCHVDRRPAGDILASLPALGTSVAVRYLPENPAHAVIARLVTRWKR